jgi:type IV pilus assembly protein PilM
MASSNISWGIEIGAGGVRAIKLAADGDAVKILEFASFDHAKVLSTPDIDQDDVMRVAIGTLASRYDLSGAQIAISIPGHQSFARFAKLPPVEPKKVPDIVKFEAVQQIPFPLEDVEWDFQTFLSPDSPEVEVGIFAVMRERIMERLTLLEDVGITPDIATLSPLSVYNAFAYDLDFAQNMPGTILLDIGTLATDLVIAHSGRVWVRTFPIGGHQFTEALVETFKVPYSKAEKLKKEAEKTKHARHVFQAMRPVFTDLVQEVQRSIGYYQSLHPDAELKRLIGTGSTFRLPGLRKYLKQQLQLDVYRLEQFKKISVDDAHAGEFQTASLNLATAYGLALQGLGLASLNANLMPVKMVRDAMWKRKVGWFGAAAAVAAVASGAWFVRPFLDNAAITAAGTPAVFNQAINEANATKARAQSAGVLSDSGLALNAEEMIDLIDTDQVYAHVVADMGQMFEKADEVGRGTISGGEPAFTLLSVNTDYSEGEKEEAAADDPNARFNEPGGRNEFDPGGPDSMIIAAPVTPVRGGRNKPAARGGDPEEVKAIRRIRVEMVVTTTHPEPQDFMDDSIQAWLQENAQRADVPYSIHYDVDLLVYEKLDEDGQSTARRPGAGFRSSPRGRPGGSSGISTIINIDPGGRPVGVNNPDERGGGGWQSGGRSARGGGDLDQLAPIVPPEDRSAAPTGQFTVVWFVLLDPPAEDTQGGDE